MAMKDASTKLKGSDTDYRDTVHDLYHPQSCDTQSLPRVDVENALIENDTTEKPDSACLFSIPHANKLGLEFDARWAKVINDARLTLPHVFPELHQSTELLVVPPTLLSPHLQGLSDDVRKRLKNFGTITDIYRRPLTTGERVHSGLQPHSLLGKLWADVSACSPISFLLPQPTTVRTTIDDHYFPRPCTYSFLGATRPYTVKALLRFINEVRYTPLHSVGRRCPNEMAK